MTLLHVQLRSHLTAGGGAAFPPSLRPSVRDYRWHVLGGPSTATVEAVGAPDALFGLLDRLGVPVEIVSWRGIPVWWGYLDGATVTLGAASYGLSLRTMANRVNILYQDGYDLGWISDNPSIALYGTKELFVPLNDPSDTQAQNERARVLELRKYPVPEPDSSSGGWGGGLDSDAATAQLHCRGWWDTLDWKYWEDTTPDVETDHVSKILTVIADAGQFLTGAVALTGSGTRGLTSGLLTYPEADGTQTARTYIEDLLRRGTTNRRRLMATVQRDRTVVITEEPEPGSNDYYRDGGQLRDRLGSILMAEIAPVGIWTRLSNTAVPASVSQRRTALPAVALIEDAAVNAATLERTLTPRGSEDPWAMWEVTPE